MKCKMILGKRRNQLKITYTITIKMNADSQEYSNKQILKHSNLCNKYIQCYHV